MDLKDKLFEIFGKDRIEIGKIELSPTDTVRAMGDHVDFIYNGKAIFRAYSSDNYVFTSIGLSNRKMRDRINACLYALGTTYEVFMKDGKVYCSSCGRNMRNSVELDLVSMYKSYFENNIHHFEKI